MQLIKVGLCNCAVTPCVTSNYVEVPLYGVNSAKISDEISFVRAGTTGRMS